MKKIILTSLVLAATVVASAQGQSHKTKLVLSAGLTQDTTITGNQDTVKLKFGTGQVWIIGTDENGAKADSSSAKKEAPKKVEDYAWSGWDGIDVGVSGWFTPTNAIQVDGRKDLELDYKQSVYCAINLLDKRVELIPNRLALVTGLGFQLQTFGMKNNYRMVDSPDSLYGTLDNVRNYKRNSLNANYLTVPLVLQFNTKRNLEEAFHVSAGVMGGYLLSSNFFYKWDENGKTQKEKAEGNYNLNPFQVNAVAEIGFGNYTLVGTYGLNPLFQKDKAPELQSFSVALRIPF